MQRLDVSGAVRPIEGSLGVKELRLYRANFMQLEFAPVKNIQRTKSLNF
jgi:hypothetical protein